MTTPTTKPSREGLKIAEALDRPGKLHRWPESGQKLAEVAAIIDAHIAPLLRIKEAAKPFAKFIEQFDRMPIKGLHDEFYGIHTGTEFEAVLKLSDLRKLRAALSEVELRLSG